MLPIQIATDEGINTNELRGAKGSTLLVIVTTHQKSVPILTVQALSHSDT
jgi:hypothetical protein